MTQAAMDNPTDTGALLPVTQSDIELYDALGFVPKAINRDKWLQLIARHRHQSGRTEVGCTIPAEHPLAKGLRTSQKALDEIKRQEQANIAGYLAMRDMPIGSVAADARHQSGRTGAGEAKVEAYILERIEGEGYGKARRVLDATYHNPTSDGFFVDADTKARHRVTPLYALSQSTAGEDGEALRQQGQREGKAAVCQWLRGRGAMRPPAVLHHAAGILADQFEQSEIPGASQ